MNENKQELIKAKIHAQKVFDTINYLNKNCKQKSPIAIKIMEVLQDFINCHLSSPAIYLKYHLVLQYIQQYMTSQGEEDAQLDIMEKITD